MQPTNGNDVQSHGSSHTNNPGPDVLRRLYAVEGKTVREIASSYYVEETTVRHWLSNAKIRRPAGKREQWRKNPGADVLRQECLVKGKSDKEIAKDYDVNERTIRRWRKLAGIRRTPKDAPEKPSECELQKMYIQDHMTARQIAKELHTTEPIVRRWISEYRIMKRKKDKDKGKDKCRKQ